MNIDEVDIFWAWPGTVCQMPLSRDPCLFWKVAQLGFLILGKWSLVWNFQILGYPSCSIVWENSLSNIESYWPYNIEKFNSVLRKYLWNISRLVLLGSKTFHVRIWVCKLSFVMLSQRKNFFFIIRRFYFHYFNSLWSISFSRSVHFIRLKYSAIIR